MLLFLVEDLATEEDDRGRDEIFVILLILKSNNLLIRSNMIYTFIKISGYFSSSILKCTALLFAGDTCSLDTSFPGTFF